MLIQTRREIGWAILSSLLLLGQAYIERKIDDLSGASYPQVIVILSVCPSTRRLAKYCYVHFHIFQDFFSFVSIR